MCARFDSSKERRHSGQSSVSNCKRQRFRGTMAEVLAYRHDVLCVCVLYMYMHSNTNIIVYNNEVLTRGQNVGIRVFADAIAVESYMRPTAS